MDIVVKRYSDNGESTLGLLFINGKFECYTLEDEARTRKVWGETCIPEGTYVIQFRTEGGHNIRYGRKFGAFHHGMLHVQDVPNFKYILIHIGNDDDDTAGCLLVGTKSNSNVYSEGFIEASTGAYTKLYEKVSNELLDGKRVQITYESIH